VGGQLAWSGFEKPLFSGQGEMGEIGETRETGEKREELLRRTDGVTVHSTIGPEWRSNNNLLTGLTVSPVSQILPPALLSG
jgi:hypothetical protein